MEYEGDDTNDENVNVPAGVRLRFARGLATIPSRAEIADSKLGSVLAFKAFKTPGVSWKLLKVLTKVWEFEFGFL